MNIHSNKSTKKEVESVSTRVQNTKQEIEQLKNELEKLICTGAQAAIPKLPLEKLICTGDQAAIPKLPLEIKAPEVHIPEPKHVEVQLQPKKMHWAPPKKPEPVHTSPSKKSRNYNVEEARDYIKKQKEKRAEELKAQINKADNQLDLKRQKLRELHQKTIELVTKNVQMKRERSKSREKEPPVRIDKSNPQHKPPIRPKEISKSQDRVNQPPVPSMRIKSQERLKEPSISKARVKSQERLKEPSVSKARVKSQEPPVSSKRVQEKAERVSRPRTRDKLSASASMPSVRPHKIDPNFLYAPNANFTSKSEGKIIDLEKTVCPPQRQEVDLNKRIVSESNKPSKQKKEHCIMTDACLRDTKETQTSRSNNFGEVAWMQPSSVMPFPYNFINTVKKKLQFAISSPSCVDVGVQNTWDQTPEVSKPKSKEEIRELLIKSASSDLKSFASHKCQNLDLKAVENLELIPSNQRERVVSKNLFDDYDSESDTSKNIPEISSESLSLEKLKDLKLQKVPKSLSHGSINTDTNGYSSDFQKESAPSAKSKAEKSDSSTIKTVTSEKKQSQFAVPSDISASSTLTNNSSTSDNQSPKRPEVSNPTSFINTERRSVGDSQKSFMSLLTEGQLSKTESGSISEKVLSNFLSESLNLKEPTASLTVKKNEPSSDLTRSLMKTVTIRPSSSPTTNGSTDAKDPHSVEDVQESFQTLITEDKVSKSATESVLENLEAASSDRVTQSLNLKEPTVSLSVGINQKKNDLVKSQMKNVTLRPASASNNVNEIHLKFEAEVRLLNDFNESFKQFVAVEKAFENLKNKNDTNSAMNKILQNVDTQTSFVTKTSTNISSEKSPRDNRTSSINFSRGSDIIEEIDDLVVNDNKSLSKSQLSLSTDWNLSNLNDSTSTNISIRDEEKSRFSLSNVENYNVKNCAGLLSLNIFDQLIKDEDTRIQQLKAIIKIREQALLDRTRSELVWLEFQKKQLIETGKIEEASLLKKKQRGIILKHEQERNEIKKLKQMQKEASEHRKNTLKQQRNLIKHQLSTDNMLSKITVKKRKERRSMGPLRVVQSCSESIHSETSMKSSGMEDVLSITSKSVRVSEESEVDFSMSLKEEDVPVANAKRTLLMREAALQKRRKTAEELLRWHRKLLDEERKIGELEAAATSVVGKRTHEAAAHRDKYKFNGKQLNQLWKNMTGSEEKKFVDDKLYVMSQMTLERLCKSARQYSNKNRKVRSSEQSSAVSEEARKSTDDANYSSVFETESVQEINNSQEEKTKISSISELIDNFSRIEDEISTLSKKSEEIVSPKEVSEVRDDEKESSKSEEIVSLKEVAEEDEKESSKSEEIEKESESSSVEEVETVEESPKKSEETTPEEHITETEEQKSPDQTGPKLDQEQISTKSEDVETQIEEPEKSTIEITTETEETSKDIGKELLSLEEAIESASKIEESLSRLNERLGSEKKEDASAVEDTKLETSITTEDETSQKTSKIEEKESDTSSAPSAEEKSETPSKSRSTEADEKTSQKKSPPSQIDVKKRVSEILADATLNRGDRSPRLQDLYVTTYDVLPPNSLELNEPAEEPPSDILGTEAEELWRKQLAIEQEIKQIQLQQKEQLPYLYVREIPNKPPPPYTPPSSLSSLPLSILPPDVKEISEVASYSSKVLYKAYQNNNLEKVKFSENGFKLFSKVEVTKACAEFVFNICRDLARDYYKQFEIIEEPSWLVLAKKPQLAKTKPPDATGLERIFINKLKELFGFKKVQVVESAIIKWGRKKRDHVDEVLVIESQEEESQWTNFDKDELIVKNQLTADIMKMLIEETASVFAKILTKKKKSVLG